MAYWLWYPCDFEIYHGMRQNMQREERGYGWPAYWKMDDWRKHVIFRHAFETSEESNFTVYAEGSGHVRLDGRKYPFDKEVICPAGKHLIEIDVGHMAGLPAVYVEGEVIQSTPDWTADDYEQELPAGWSPLYQDRRAKPSKIPCNYIKCLPVEKKAVHGGVVFDFGREVNGEVTLQLADPSRSVTAAYGESETEALDVEHCYYREEKAASGTSLRKRAFRYLFVPDILPEEVDCSAIHEEFPFSCRASFKSSDPLMDQIWHTAKETFRLCSGLFFIDGIKRDRWIWSGDAYQSYFVNQYLFFDEEINKRTIRALRGNIMIRQHLNTIVDYSMLWLISLENHYWMTGDQAFLVEMMPKMQAMMELLEGQVNELGFIYGRKQDWIYIDWAEMDKSGVLCAEQILLWKCYRTMENMSRLLDSSCESWQQKAKSLKMNIQKYFWNEEKKAFIDTFETGRNHVTRHANIFAILFDFVDQQQAQAIAEHVLLNSAVPEITTPYFKFFELDVWGKLGRLDLVWHAVRNYWGGMIRQGAVTFWEQYDPGQQGAEHYAMYGDPYGKSLCHAWAASPIYLLGRYFLGVRPTEPGYRRYKVEPKLSFFRELHCDIPMKNGTVRLDWENGKLEVFADCIGGELLLNGISSEIPVKEKRE